MREDKQSCPRDEHDRHHHGRDRILVPDCGDRQDGTRGERDLEASALRAPSRVAPVGLEDCSQSRVDSPGRVERRAWLFRPAPRCEVAGDQATRWAGLRTPRSPPTHTPCKMHGVCRTMHWSHEALNLAGVGLSPCEQAMPPPRLQLRVGKLPSTRCLPTGLRVARRDDEDALPQGRQTRGAGRQEDAAGDAGVGDEGDEHQPAAADGGDRI